MKFIQSGIGGAIGSIFGEIQPPNPLKETGARMKKINKKVGNREKRKM